MDPGNFHEKNFGPEIYPRKKFCTYEILTRKKCGSSKYPQETILDLRDTHDKYFGPTKSQRQKYFVYEIPTRENFGPTKYSQRHDGRWH